MQSTNKHARNEAPATHSWHKNHTGSSKSMEPIDSYRYADRLSFYGARLGILIDDSLSIHYLRDKLGDLGDITSGVMLTMSQNSSLVDLKDLHKEMAFKLGDEPGMKRALLSIIPHQFNNHHKLPWMKGDTLRGQLDAIMQKFTTDAMISKIMEVASTQQNEAFHSTVTHFTSKNVFHGRSSTYIGQVSAAVAHHNLRVHICSGFSMN